MKRNSQIVALVVAVAAAYFVSQGRAEPPAIVPKEGPTTLPAASEPAETPAAKLGDALKAGDYKRKLTVDGMQRYYLVHVPPKYDNSKPTPVVVILHGGWSNAAIMVIFCGLNAKADDAGFVAVYPNGLNLCWNSFVLPGPRSMPDDVKFIGKVLDDLGTVINVDKRRVFATGMSNGAMMCYRLAAEMPDRFAAVAPVSGTISIVPFRPKGPISLIHFHGTQDKFVAMDGKMLNKNFLRASLGGRQRWHVRQARRLRRDAGSHGDPRHGQRRDEGHPQGLGARQKRERGGAVRHRRRRPHLAGTRSRPQGAGQVDQEHLGHRPDLGVLPETPHAGRDKEVT